MINKVKLLAALRDSIQSPRAGELLIHRIEQGEFDVEAPSAEGGKKKSSKSAAD